MKGVLFGAYHSYRDLHLILSEKEIGAPQVKTQTLDIPGGDGELDFTEFFGEPKYGNVQHKFTFTTIQKDLLTQFSTVKNALHGRKVRIVLDDDPTFFYTGRCDVSSFKDEHGVGTIVVTCDCEPYKYKIALTVRMKSMLDNTTETIYLTNSRKHAVPTVEIETEDSINIVFNSSNVWDLGSGTYTLPELELVEGDNPITLTGTGLVTFIWREGDL